MELKHHFIFRILYICLRILRGSDREGNEIGRPSHLHPYYYIVCNNSSDPQVSIKDDTFSSILSNIGCLLRILTDGDSHHEELSTRTFLQTGSELGSKVTDNVLNSQSHSFRRHKLFSTSHCSSLSLLSVLPSRFVFTLKD